MNQNERKEPTFGQADVKNTQNIAPSLRTTQSPGHTFTPVIKPAGSVKSELPRMEGGEAAQPAGFTFSPVVEEKGTESVQSEQSIEETQEKVAEMKEEVKAETQETEVKEDKSVAQETLKVAINAAERVIPTAATASNTENKVKESSSKRRRLGIVALLAAVLGAVFFWLKPSTPETVEELQSQQSGSLPIEFRPVDEAEAQRQEAEAKAQAQAQQEVAAQQAQAAQQAGTQPAPSQEANVAPVQPSQPQPVQPVANELAQPQLNPTQVAQPQPVQPQTVTVPTMEKPETQGSVVYQPETQTVQVPQPATPRVEKMRASHQNNKTTQPKVKAVTKSEFDAKKAQNAQMDRLVKNVEAGKSVAAKPAAPSLAAKTEAAQAANAIASSKTLSVPKGVSLMQVFRDNQLNISDVNAMSKVNNKVSNLKVNEKVTVRLDKNNRVVEMSIGSGGKFTRQTDGSYRFK